MSCVWGLFFVLSASFSSISLLCNPLYTLYLPLSLPSLVHSACCHAGPHPPLVLPTPHLNHLLLLILLPSTFSPYPHSLLPLILLPPSLLPSLLLILPFIPPRPLSLLPSGLFTHGVNYELAVEHHDRMKQARKMISKGKYVRSSSVLFTKCYVILVPLCSLPCYVICYTII